MLTCRSSLEGDQEGVLANCGIDLEFIAHHAPVAGQLAVGDNVAALGIHVAHTESRWLSNRLGDAGIGGYHQPAPLHIVPCLGETDGREIDAMDGRIGELAQVGLVEQSPQGSLVTGFGGHHRGVELTPGVRLMETETPGELPGFPVPSGFVMRLCMGFQLCVYGMVPVFSGEG